MTETKAIRTARAAAILTKRLAPSSSPRVAEAIQALDPERVSGVPGIVAAFEARAEQIRRDRELSAEGQRARIKAAAGTALGNIAGIAQRIAAMEVEHRADSGNVPLPPLDATIVMVDLALAAQIKADQATSFALEYASERVRLAAARMPRELTGLTPEQQARAHASLMPADVAARIGDEAVALDAARTVVQAAIDELALTAGLEARELVQLFSNAWRLPGVATTMAGRLASEATARPEA